MRSHIMRWLETPKDRAIERELEGLTIQVGLLTEQVRALYDLLGEYQSSGTLILPPWRLRP